MDQRDGVTAVTATRYPPARRKRRKREGAAAAARGGGRWACAVTPSRPSFAALRSSLLSFLPRVVLSSRLSAV